MNLPNKLTVIRCVMTPIFLLAMLWNFPGHYAVALVLFIAASLTDLIDGRIARSRNLVTNLGKFLDPLADKTLTTAAFLGLLTVFRNDLLCWAVMIILAREFMVTSVRLLAAKDGVVVAASMAGKTKTVLQMTAIIYMLTLLQTVEWFRTVIPVGIVAALWVIGNVLIWASVIATVVSGIQYVWQLRQYFTEK